MPTRIEWAGETWNPITGCTKISAGCANCYAERMANRLANMPGSGYDKENPFGVKFHPGRLDQPLHWKKPRKIFVCSMGDIFHEDVTDSWLDDVFFTAANLARQHTYLVLTKRPQRMYEYFTKKIEDGFTWREGITYVPLPNVWLGVTAENQQAADERIPVLLQTPAAKRFVSVEPMLGPVSLGGLDFVSNIYRPWIDYPDVMLDWVICGGETGPGARPMHPDWARSLRDQCVSADVPFFFKSLGEYRRWSHVLDEYKGDPPPPFVDCEGVLFSRVGKKAAGRLLDGREWSEWPEVKE